MQAEADPDEIVSGGNSNDWEHYLYKFLKFDAFSSKFEQITMEFKKQKFDAFSSTQLYMLSRILCLYADKNAVAIAFRFQSMLHVFFMPW